MSKRRPWYPWCPSDYQQDTQLLSEEADLLYRRLLDACWQMDGVLPKQLESLAKVSRLQLRKFKRVWPEVSPFFYEIDGKLRQKRIDKEIQKVIEISEKRADAARKKAAANAEQMDLQLQNNESLQMHTHPHPHPHNNNNPPEAPPLKPDDPDNLPDNLNRAAWDDWIAYRRKMRLKKYKTNRSAVALAKFPQRIQAAAVEQSMRQQWQGLFPEKINPSVTKHETNAVEREYAEAQAAQARRTNTSDDQALDRNDAALSKLEP